MQQKSIRQNILNNRPRKARANPEGLIKFIEISKATKVPKTTIRCAAVLRYAKQN